MEEFSHVGAALLYTFIGLVIYVVSFITFDRLTPGHLWREILEERNMAIAVLFAGVAVGISVIIAAAIKG